MFLNLIIFCLIGFSLGHQEEESFGEIKGSPFKQPIDLLYKRQTLFITKMFHYYLFQNLLGI